MKRTLLSLFTAAFLFACGAAADDKQGTGAETPAEHTEGDGHDHATEGHDEKDGHSHDDGHAHDEAAHDTTAGHSHEEGDEH